MVDFTSLPLDISLVIFAACALVIMVFGTRLSGVADQLADRTGLGEAVAGGVLLGGVTSLPGAVVSISAGLEGRPDLALGNAIGGIAVQTLFLAVADLFYTRANLEHAAASLANIAQGGLLILLLSILGIARFMPEITILGAHPSSWLLLFCYIYGLRVVSHVVGSPMWRPQQTDETRPDIPEDEHNLPSLRRLWIAFLPLAVVLASVGWVLERVVSHVTQITAITESAAGLLVTSTCTSLPELITSVAAVRRGALTLAVGGIVGGNMFDSLFSTAADFSYQQGSIYHAVSEDVTGWILLGIMMMSILVLGLVRREKYGVARIGGESIALVACYAAGIYLLTH